MPMHLTNAAENADEAEEDRPRREANGDAPADGAPDHERDATSPTPPASMPAGTPPPTASPVPELRLNLHDDEGRHRAENLDLPVLTQLAIRARIADALDHVAVTRKGAVVIGPKGTGKSYALEQAVADFQRLEARKAHENDGYARRSVLPLPALAARRYFDALLFLCRRVIGPTFSASVRGKQKKEDDLLTELVRTCLDQRIVALVIDEAERISKEGHRLLRDIMADAEWHDTGRHAVAGRVRAGGVGVLIVGTPAVRPFIERSGEARHRWTLRVDVGMVPPDLVAPTYLQWFPAWRSHVAHIGEQAWIAYIAKHVTLHRPVEMRLLTEHARTYFRRAQRNVQMRGGLPPTLEQTPFVAQLFEYTIRQARWLGDEGGAHGIAG